MAEDVPDGNVLKGTDVHSFGHGHLRRGPVDTAERYKH